MAPLERAGAPVWERLRALGVGAGSRLGVVGVGGLGHLAVTVGVTLCAEVTVLTTSPATLEEARALGAHHVVPSTDEDAMAAATATLDVVIDCVPVAHPFGPVLATLVPGGTLCVVGCLGTLELDVMDLLVGRKRLTGSGSAGTAATQEMLDVWGEHDVVADVEVLSAREVGTALEPLERGDVR